MNSFIQQFKIFQNDNPLWSSWVCFCETLKKFKLKDKKKIRIYFNQLVDKKDYDKREKRQLVEYLVSPNFCK